MASSPSRALKRVWDIELTTGVEVRVTPAPAGIQVRLLAEAGQLYAFDEDKYRKPVENSLDPHYTIVDKSDPEYQREKREYERNLNAYVVQQLYRRFVKVEDDLQRNLLALYADDIDAVRDLYDDNEDDWYICLDAFVLGEPVDKRAVVDALQNKAPVTDEELNGALAIFRYRVRRRNADQPRRNPGAPGDEATADRESITLENGA